LIPEIFHLSGIMELPNAANFSGSSGVKAMRLKIPDFFLTKT